MKSTFHYPVSIILTILLFSSCAPKSAPDQPTQEQLETELREANDQFYAALNAMFVGDLEPMNNIWSHSEEVTDLGPFGGERLLGWEAVGNEFKHEAGLKLGGKVVCEDLLIRVSNEMAYTTCVERGENMDADGVPVEVKFRATNIFRRENDSWKLVHHHTDLSKPLQDVDTELESSVDSLQTTPTP